jgi:hypothetical protein
MISREEKNKGVVKELQKERTIAISKKILHFFLIILVTFSLLFSYTFFLGVKGLNTKEYIIKDESIPKSFYGIKILHISDLLYGSTILQSNLDTILEEARLINPDIIVYTGNLISANYSITNEDINNINIFLKNLPFKLGKYAVKGNLDTSTFNLIMENTDFSILNSEVVNVYNNSDFISIVGIDVNNSLDITLDSNAYTICLINNYDNYNTYHIKANVVLAGNNLGGEIRFFNYPLLGTNKYNNTYYEENNSKIFISSGLGTYHHMRFMNHPSLNVYRLKIN